MKVNEKVKEQFDTKICWFCKEKPSGSDQKVELFRRFFSRSISTKTTQHHYFTKTILVPRCKRCAVFHKLIYVFVAIVMIIAVVGGYLGGYIFYKLYRLDELWLVLIALGIGILCFCTSLILIFLIARRVFALPKNFTDEKSYPEIAKLISEGWKIGSYKTSPERYD